MRWGNRNRQARAVILPPLPPLPEVARATAPLARAPIVAESAPPATEAPALLETIDVRPEAMWSQLAAIADIVADARITARTLSTGVGYPRAAYDRFRRDFPVRPPPGILPDAQGVTAIVDATRAAPFLLRETLRSLQEQSVRGWRAVVLASETLQAHPVASFADTDSRIAFAASDAPIPSAGRVLLVTAGARLDAEALAWLLFASDRTGARVAFSDHDHGVIVPGVGPVRADPWLYWARDPAMLAHIAAPALVLADAGLALAVRGEADGGDGWRRRVLLAAEGAAPHVPRLLATLVELPLIARGGPPRPEDLIPGHLSPVTVAPTPARMVERVDRIAVIIPTRDGGDMLERAIESLHATARAADRIEVIVVDNGSDGATIAALAGRGLARRLAFDRPFNWALLNNFAAAACDAPVLVFANDDLEMIRRGWDDALLAALDDAPVGVVGARLLYPNRTVQHGGMVFGLGPGHPEHEGRAAAASDAGPGRRLVIPRDVASVTGAFLGCRRTTFEAVDGFDAATMFVGHSDVDFCLKVREAGRTIRYEPRIEAIHYESITRGRNVSKAQVAWDEGERAELIDRWGASLVDDPGVNPYWAKGGTPFEAFREPAMIEIVEHIDRTGREQPWHPSRRSAQEAEAWAPSPTGRG